MGWPRPACYPPGDAGCLRTTMKTTQKTVTIHHEWNRERNTHILNVWADGQVVDHQMSIVHLDDDMAAAVNDDGQDVTPGWWIEGDGQYFERLHDGEDSGPLDALIRREHDGKLAELRGRLAGQ